jgi:hypothetical protein
MKNTIELQLRALRPPRILKKTDEGVPDFADVWAIHHDGDRSSHKWAIAVKFGRQIAGEVTAVNTGTLFTVRGRLDQSKNPKTGLYHTFIWAEGIADIVPSMKAHAKSPEPELREAARDEEIPESDFPEADLGDENPEPEIPYA